MPGLLADGTKCAPCAPTTTTSVGRLISPGSDLEDRVRTPRDDVAQRGDATHITVGMNDHKMSMVPLLVQSRDVPGPVREKLEAFMRDPSRTDAGCEAAFGLLQSFDLSKREVMDLMGFEQAACACC